MADKDTKNVEREYVIPLRRHYLRVPHYRRTGKAITAIKIFVAKHMKVADRDIKNVKLDVYFNNTLWAKGRTNPPTRIKVKARRDGELVYVTFVEMPKEVGFAKAKHERMHKPADKAAAPAVEEKKEEKTAEQKKDESEKEKSTAIAKEAEIKQDANATKHTTAKPQKATRPQRMALQK